MEDEGGPVLDLDRLATWMKSAGVEVVGRLGAERLGDGRSNLTYALRDAGGNSWVVRRPPQGHLLQSAHDVERECRILTALADTEVPVPTVVGLAQAGVAAETAVLVMDHVDGVVLGSRLASEHVTPETRRRLGEELVRVLARIHNTDLVATGLEDLASHAPYAARQLKRWSRQLEKARTRDLPLLDRLTELLGRRLPRHHGVALVHGDFNLGNLIVDVRAGSVAAVIDWELCTLGDPLADMGSLLAYWRHDDEDAVGTFATTALPGFPHREELAAFYLDLTDADPADLEYWHALGLWKLAVIGEGVLHRNREDQGNGSVDLSAGAEQVDDLIRRAWEVASTSGLDS